MAERKRNRTSVPRPEPGPGRFDATIHPGPGMKDVSGLDAVPLDRMPDRYGRLRALVTAEECVRLLDLGYEVRLHRHHSIQPLDPGQVTSDETAQRLLEERLASVRPATARGPARSKRKR